ncbi:MAG: calcium/sodium antiporter [Bacteroidales bacterium]|nr:calcium/sodium antiporter [Bacteroidales bacterium]
MDLLILILKLIAGLALVLLGSDALVEGSSSVARRFGVSEFVIGLTIVGIGTSMPELVVSLLASIEGKGDMSIGNVVGSNIFNTALILGVTAFIAPMAVTRDNFRRDLPLNVTASLVLMCTGLSFTLFGLGNDSIGRIPGAVFLLAFAAYLFFSFRNDAPEEGESEEQKERSLLVSILMIAAGLGGLIWGGNVFVNSATGIAEYAGVSEKFIAVTLLAGGTSLPELATCIVAALKGRSRMALGNIIGSNIANILLILGSSALIRPLLLTNINVIDFGTMLGLSVLLMLVALGKKKVLGRVAGTMLLLAEAAYMTHLIINLN